MDHNILSKKKCRRHNHNRKYLYTFTNMNFDAHVIVSSYRILVYVWHTYTNMTHIQQSVAVVIGTGIPAQACDQASDQQSPQQCVDDSRDDQVDSRAGILGSILIVAVVLGHIALHTEKATCYNLCHHTVPVFTHEYSKHQCWYSKH